jgi:Na+/proline symporter
MMLVFAFSSLLIINGFSLDQIALPSNALLSLIIMLMSPIAGGFLAGLIAQEKPRQAGLIAGLIAGLAASISRTGMTITLHKRSSCMRLYRRGSNSSSVLEVVMTVGNSAL